MLYSSALIALSALTGYSSAQYTIDPNSVNLTTRETWCSAQLNTCPEICGSLGTTSNNCSADTLSYSCICRDGSSPDVANYEQTVPYFECETYVSNCVAANTSSASNQALCLAISCGDEVAGTSSTSSSSSSSSTSAAAAATSSAASTTSAAASSTSASASAASATKTSAAVAVAMARDYGTAALMAGLLAAFGLAI